MVDIRAGAVMVTRMVDVDTILIIFRQLTVDE